MNAATYVSVGHTFPQCLPPASVVLKAGRGTRTGPDAVPSWRRLQSARVSSPACGTHREDRLLCPVPGGHESQFVRQVRLEEDGNVPGKQDGDEIAGTESTLRGACGQRGP